MRRPENSPPDAEEVYVPRRISRALAAELIRRFPRLKRIYVPQSVLQQTSRRVIEALKHVGIDVLPTGRGRGRPRKYGEEIAKRAREMREQGKSAREIAEALGIPLRTVYHILRQSYKGGRR